MKYNQYCAIFALLPGEQGISFFRPIVGAPGALGPAARRRVVRIYALCIHLAFCKFAIGSVGGRFADLADLSLVFRVSQKNRWEIWGKIGWVIGWERVRKLEYVASPTVWSFSKNSGVWWTCHALTSAEASIFEVIRVFPNLLSGEDFHRHSAPENPLNRAV